MAPSHVPDIQYLHALLGRGHLVKIAHQDRPAQTLHSKRGHSFRAGMERASTMRLMRMFSVAIAENELGKKGKVEMKRGRQLRRPL
jgi:hypothetical protein